MTTTRSRKSKPQEQKERRRVFSDRLNELRLERGLSVENFADLLDAKTNTVRDWLNARVLARADPLVAIARRFGVAIDWLLGMEGAPKYPAQWSTVRDFEVDLASAVTDNVRRRRGDLADILHEFEISGQVALEHLSDLVADDILGLAEQRARWIARRDALAMANEELQRLAKTNADHNLGAQPASKHRKVERAARATERSGKHAPRETSDQPLRTIEAMIPAFSELQTTMNEDLKLRSGIRGLVSIASTSALNRIVPREGEPFDHRPIANDLESSRRIARGLEKGRKSRKVVDGANKPRG